MPLATKVKAWLAAPFAFTSVPVTILTVLLYLGVFVSVIYTDELPDVPNDTRGLNIDRAYEELHQITTQPHPYLSHANDDVRSYLLSRLRPIVSTHPFVHLSDDLTSNASYVEIGTIAGQDNRGVYFEGNNILVKIDGTDEPLASPDQGPSGVLFSAHYDSVSTAPGATDDGMGVVTLLELVRYFAHEERRPRRTAVFFLNNGEEDGLNGAHVYFEHPWSNLTSTFINLEGAASGGRSLIFRSTSLRPVLAFHSASHPHAEVIGADAFTHGIIRSGTDYQVYERGLKGKVPGMEGLDLAFYKHRAYYHTSRDSIPFMGYRDARKALWAMLDNVRDAGTALLNDDALRTVNGQKQAGVYFDIWGNFLITFSSHALYVFNIVFLVLGSMSTLGLLAWLLVVSKAFAQNERARKWSDIKSIVKECINWGRFWIALVVLILANAFVILGYRAFNPYIIHGHDSLVLLSFLSLSYLSLAFSLQVLHIALPTPVSSQKLAILLEFYFLTWILLLISTVAINKYHIGGVYWVTLWNIGAWAAAGLALLEGVKREQEGGARGHDGGLRLSNEAEEVDVNEDERRLVRGIRYDALTDDDDQEGVVVETEPTEITPLVRQRSNGQARVANADEEEHGWWVLQMLAVIPLPVLLIFRVALLLVNCQNHTLVDGSSPTTVYTSLAVLTGLVFLPITPFAHKLGKWLTFLAALVLAITLIINWTAFPFTFTLPFKVFFVQKVELGIAGSTYDSAQQSVFYSTSKATTQLVGLREYVEDYVTHELPSSWGKNVTCNKEAYKPGLFNCGWDSDLLPFPGGNVSTVQLTHRNVHIPFMQQAPPTHWIKLSTKRRNATSAVVSIKGTNTRACRLYFDRPIHYFHVLNSKDGFRRQPHPDQRSLQPGYEMPGAGIQELRLWSRTWDKEFVVELAWNETNSPMHGRAACEWAEYASGTAGREDASGTTVLRGATIPAFEEVKQFLPIWAVPTKLQDGLVEAWTSFSL